MGREKELLGLTPLLVPFRKMRKGRRSDGMLRRPFSLAAFPPSRWFHSVAELSIYFETSEISDMLQIISAVRAPLRLGWRQL